MPRFVILEHDHPQRHWDFFLEAGQVLRAWRLAEPPQPGRPITATATPGHRLLYLNYEGPVSGNRGHVVRWDGGDFEWQVDEQDTVAVRLHGGRVMGSAVLTRTTEGAWEFTLRPDPGDSGQVRRLIS
jgi:DNA polymerase Ligase (LigD)